MERLKDTVQPFHPSSGDGTGFLFSAYDPTAFLESVNSAVCVYEEGGKVWLRLQRNCMEQRYSWDRSAGEYAKLYSELQSRPSESHDVEKENLERNTKNL